MLWASPTTRWKTTVERIGGLLTNARKDLGLGIDRDPGAGMPEALGHDLGMNSLKQEQRRVGVSKVVEAHMGSPRSARNLESARALEDFVPWIFMHVAPIFYRFGAPGEL